LTVALGVFGPAAGFRGVGVDGAPDKITESDTPACTFRLKLHAGVSQTAILGQWRPPTGVGSAGPHSEHSAPAWGFHLCHSRWQDLLAAHVHAARRRRGRLAVLRALLVISGRTGHQHARGPECQQSSKSRESIILSRPAAGSDLTPYGVPNSTLTEEGAVIDTDTGCLFDW